MKPSKLRVSDHAVLRYLERVGGFDIDRLRNEIRQRCLAAAESGATGVVVDGFSYRIEIDDSGLPVVATVMKVEGQSNIVVPRQRKAQRNLRR